MVTSATNKSLSGLGDLLGDILSRLEALEANYGNNGSIGTKRSEPQPPPPPPPPPPSSPLRSRSVSVTITSSSQHHDDTPSVTAYDAYVQKCVAPFCATCDQLKLDDMGDQIFKAWEGIRTIIVLASRSKNPSGDDVDLAGALGPHLAPVQEAVKAIRGMKLHRDLDRHQKSVIEMLSCLSWVLCAAPKQLPSPFVKESVGSVEFWTNRIRKDYKGVNATQIAFCDGARTVITGLSAYVEDFHKTSLSFNPRGLSLAEASIRLRDEIDNTHDTPAVKSPISKHHPTIGAVVPRGNVAGLLDELGKRQSDNGDSAATGLKHVTKDQQTWRKEFKSTAPALPAVPKLANDGSLKIDERKKKSPLTGLPIFEYQDRGFKWVVENHTKESVIKEASSDGVLTIEITDPKQQVYLYNCDNIAVNVIGKFKSLILDKCRRSNVVFDTLISSVEIINCEKIKIQVQGLCPVFTIDKTKNILIWLSQQSIAASSFTTSLSTEMNVTFPDGEDMKELPIPEQFVHNLNDRFTLNTEVSELYH